MSWLKFINCPICGCGSGRKLYEHHQHGFQFYYYICMECGYVYQKARHPRDVYEQLPYETQVNYDDHTKNRADYIFDFCVTLHQSRYWGNIKAIFEKNRFTMFTGYETIEEQRKRWVKSENWRLTLAKRYLAKATYPFYRWSRKNFNIEANA